MLNQLRSMELGRCLKPVDAIILVMVLILHVNGGLSLGYRHANVTRCVEREREALLAIKGDLVDDYNMLSSWGAAQNQQDCCTWKGVFCDNHTGQVVQLRLGGGVIEDGYTYYYRQLQGTLSPKLAELLHLTFLDLSYNHFNNSQIPAFIGSLTNLRYLDLSSSGFGNNDFKGSQTSAFIGSLTNLRYLDLSGAEFGGRFSYDQLGNLTHLQYLNLGYTNYLSRSQSRPVENLNWLPPSLKYLDLSGTNLSKVSDWLETINKLPNLRNLTLIYCQLPPPILSTLSQINSSNSLARVELDGPVVTSSILVKWLSNYNTTLVYLCLSSSQLSVIPGALKNMSSLQVLDLSSNQISVLNPNVFGNMSSLYNLDLSNNQINGLNPNVFAELSSLHVLHLSFNQISGLNPNVFGNMSSLYDLDLSNNQISGLNPNVFAELSSLHVLHLSFNQISGLNPNVFVNMSSLSDLRLSNNQISGLNPNVFAELSSLHVLHLSYNQISRLIPNVFVNMSSLHVLDLSSNQISGLVPNIFEKLSSLSYLDLHSNKISGLIPNVFVNMSSLHGLDLSSNQISGLVPNIFENMSSLSYLSLSINPLEGWIPKSFGQLCNLKYLEISNCNLHEQFFEFVQILPICAQNSLQTLELSTNNLSGSIPNLSNFLSLELLFLHENQLSDMESIGNLSSLKELSLHNNRLSGVIPESIGNSLQTLDLSFNNLTGSIPSLSNFVSLKRLDLSENQLSGMVPESIGNLSSLTYLNLSGNQLRGVISETHFSKLSRLWYLDLSSNLLAFNFTSEWVPPFQLLVLGLRSCKVGPYFPKWLRSQTSFSTLDLSYAEISDVVPNWFFDHFDYIETIDLSHNQLEGSVPLILSYASHLDLSNNKFSNMTSFLCDAKVTFLRVLNLSSNHFSGELPDCWRHFVKLQLLDLSNNDFSGEIPISIGSLSLMETLKLRTNKFVGELPSSLKNCTSLIVIDLGHNKLSMSVPAWLGVSFPNLVMLLLQSNDFNGSMPSQLCHLSHIQILDLSLNEISGTIPRCLDNLTSLTQEGNSSLTIEHPLIAQAPGSSYVDDATFMWKGVMSSYKSTLGLVKRIDLSRNRLTGGVPSEITRLVGLVSLNLSRNHLTGKIPQEIGKLQSLDNLDLSRNQLDGKIPSSFARIHQLAYLDLSYNHLSGEIPTGTQLQSFDPLFYAGNPLLCGLPLKKCVSEDTGQDRQNVSDDDEDKDELITQGFFISMGLGFAAGFWGVCGSLIFKRSWRYAYYKFLNALYDWLYVRVALVRRQLKDMVNKIA